MGKGRYRLKRYPLPKSAELPPGLRNKRLARKRYLQQNGRCFLCGEKLDLTTNRDHLWPKSEGGMKAWCNVILVHEACNLKKADSLPSREMLERFARTCAYKWPLEWISYLDAINCVPHE